MVAGLAYLINFKTDLYPSTFLHDCRYSTLSMLRIFLLVPTGEIFTKLPPLPSFELKSEYVSSGAKGALQEPWVCSGNYSFIVGMQRLRFEL